MIELNCKIGDVMLNKKGFTIAEVIVSFVLVSIILASLIGAMVYYRDKVKDEEVRTQLWDFKNSITKVMYDDIISKNIVGVENCLGEVVDNNSRRCINLVDKENRAYPLKIEEVSSGSNQGVYLVYNGVKYKLPDSDLGTGNDRVCDFISGINVNIYDNKIFKIKTSFHHKGLDIYHDILVVISI
jgi:type II secretory pathway pseudopilin PulG